MHKRLTFEVNLSCVQDAISQCFDYLMDTGPKSPYGTSSESQSGPLITQVFLSDSFNDASYTRRLNHVLVTSISRIFLPGCTYLPISVIYGEHHKVPARKSLGHSFDVSIFSSSYQKEDLLLEGHGSDNLIDIALVQLRLCISNSCSQKQSDKHKCLFHVYRL